MGNCRQLVNTHYYHMTHTHTHTHKTGRQVKIWFLEEYGFLASAGIEIPAETREERE